MYTQYQTPSANFVAIDVEYADNLQNICQFGLAVVQDGKVVETRCWNIQPPNNYYSSQQSEIHHMTSAVTANSPTFDQIWLEIETYLRNTEIWAHNAGTERNAIDKSLDYYKIAHESYIIYDSIHLYPRPDRKNWNDGRGLRACLYAVGLPCDHHHNAGADAAMCAQIIIAYQQGVKPDWERSDSMMTEYNATKQAVLQAEEQRYQAHQLDLFADVVLSSSSDNTKGTFKPTFYHGDYSNKQDGTDSIDYERLNTADTNPIHGANIVLTGFFHIARKQLREALKAMGANIKPSVTKNVQAVLLGERNIGKAKAEDLKTLIHNGYNIARISGDIDLDRLLYDASLTPADFSVPPVAQKDLNFTVGHFRKNHHKLAYPVNSIASRELYFPPTGFMGRQDLFCQICGNLGSFGNWEYNQQVNLVVLPNTSVEALQRNEKDDVIRAFEAYYNSQRAVTFDTEFITERDILKFVRERIVRCDDDVMGHLYTLYLQSAGIDPEKDFKYGLIVARDAFMKEG